MCIISSVCLCILSQCPYVCSSTISPSELYLWTPCMGLHDHSTQTGVLWVSLSQCIQFGLSPLLRLVVQALFHQHQILLVIRPSPLSWALKNWHDSVLFVSKWLYWLLVPSSLISFCFNTWASIFRPLTSITLKIQFMPLTCTASLWQLFKTITCMHLTHLLVLVFSVLHAMHVCDKAYMFSLFYFICYTFFFNV